MTQYISSFLIDPVVRQARRFSRSGYATTRPTFNSTDNEEPSVSHEDELATALNAREIRPPMRLENGGDPLADVTGVFQNFTPESEPGALDAELQAWTHRRRLAVPLRRADTAPEGYPRSRPLNRYTRYTEIGTSNNPLYGEPDRFRSDRSSVSGSVSSATDPNMMAREDPGLLSRTTEHATEDATSYDHRSGGVGSLTADDGMGHMRKKIQAIQRMDMPMTEKARLIHELMTERYSLLQTGLQASHFHRPHSPASLLSSDRPFTPISTNSIENTMSSTSPPASTSTFADPTNPFHLTSEDLKPTYVLKGSEADSGAGEERGTRLENSVNADEPKDLGCSHYKRNIKLQCSACDRWYTCRFCHDEVEDHSLNRRETKHMLCMLCGCAQAASEACVQCGERAAWYYCNVCKLWDDDPKKSIYHCNDCGICRIGQGLGKDFYHCKICCVCLSISIRDTHRCIERSTDCDCPICGEYMFTSPERVVFMRCGHSIHQRCYYEHMNSSYRCPICSRSIVNMEMQFRHLERAIEHQPMPPQFQDTKAFVYCNDCSAKTTVKYHWLGLKCAVCDSYNTAQLQILSSPIVQRAPADVYEPAPDPSSLLPNDAPTRGRPLLLTRPHQRLSISASALERTRPPTPITTTTTTNPVPYRLARSASTEASRVQLVFVGTSSSSSVSASETDTDSDSDPADSMDTGEDYSDVDFWGGESPGARTGTGTGTGEGQVRRRVHGEWSYDGDGDDDDDDDDDDDEDEDEDEDMGESVEADEGDRMEIFGHL